MKMKSDGVAAFMDHNILTPGPSAPREKNQGKS
jgi:hypothetical protein